MGVLTWALLRCKSLSGDFKNDTSDDLNNKRVIAVDPGRTNIFYMVEKLKNGYYKSYCLSRKQYYTEAGMFRATSNSNKWNLNVKDELEELSRSSPASPASLELFMRYIKTWLSVKRALWEENTKKRWASQRFKLYGNKKKVFAKFLNKLKPDDNTVLAFGSAKFAPGGKNELSVPTTRAFKECSYRFKIKLVCEFRTSKIYWKDDSILQRVVKKHVSTGKAVDVRGLLWCSSTKEKNKFMFANIVTSMLP